MNALQQRQSEKRNNNDIDDAVAADIEDGKKERIKQSEKSNEKEKNAMTNGTKERYSFTLSGGRGAMWLQ